MIRTALTCSTPTQLLMLFGCSLPCCRDKRSSLAHFAKLSLLVKSFECFDKKPERTENDDRELLLTIRLVVVTVCEAPYTCYEKHVAGEWHRYEFPIELLVLSALTS